ncbi:MAG: amidophosphoribosyltransferase [Robiginitomaculum sp.]|nr:MAG: amidophosphoribosyltransferase [Robiginitomaculum sp.]
MKRDLPENWPSLLIDPIDDKPREECGVFGVYGLEDAAPLTVLGLHGLQHRGQEACGIAVYDGAHFHSERHMGLVSDNFAGTDVAKRLPGKAAIGHVRYSTQGETALRNVQPLYADLKSGGFAVAHNGNLTNARALREILVSDGAIFQSTSDTEVVLQLVARSRRTHLVHRFIDALKKIEGAYALVALTNKKLIGARDPYGIRPLILGRLDGAPVLASETCALDMIGAKFERNIEPGEVVVITQDGVQSHHPFAKVRPRPCLFEFVYFARPDSIVDGKSVYEVRKRMGQRLAEEHPADVDVIVPVPDSGVPAALGFAQGANIPFELGIIRNHYVGRTFIQPSQSVRDMGVRLKHAANRAVLKGKRVLLVDDSIVRGTTSLKIVRMVREAGAREVHFRSASPPIRFPDFYGIDMPNAERLLASRHAHEEMIKMLEVDSLGFLSVDGLYWAMGEERRDNDMPTYADHYFTGDYPTRLYDYEQHNADKAKQLSLLSDVA